MPMWHEHTIEDISIGDFATFSKTITENDLTLYAAITGDVAPHHLDEEYAKTTRWAGRIVHGLYVAGIMSAAISKLMAPGAVTIGHELKFLAPVRVGDTVTARVEVVEKDPETRVVKLRTTCTNQRGEMVLDGYALEKMPKARSGAR